MKKYTLPLFITVLAATSSQAAITVLADAAADYVAAAGGATNTLATLPSGWSYFGSTAANGGTETALTAGQVGNQGAAYQGWVGSSTANTAAIYGTNTASPAEFEIFSNGDANGGVVGEDLLLHSGQIGNGDEFLIVRYTIGDDTNFTAGTGSISGSFRELVVGGGAAAQSISANIYHNSVSLFSVSGGTTAQGTPNILTQADGTFNITGRTFVTGDTIDFVIDPNGHFGADESALQSAISVDVVPEPTTSALLAGCLALAAVMVRRRR
ncbi:MAG: PEP-CTERM sorting domain-containing protein [Opitutaceae bacterium]